MHQQPLAHRRLTHALEAPDAYVANLHAIACDDVEADVEHPVGRIFLGNRRIDFREGVSFVCEGGLQPLAALEDFGSHRGCAGRKVQSTAHFSRYRAVDLYSTQVVQISKAEGDLDPCIIAPGARVQLLTESRIIERQAVDRDRDQALVEPVTLQHGLQAVQIATRAADQGEGPDRGRAPQGQQVGCGLERRIHRAVTRGRQVDAVGLRIGGVHGRQSGKGGKQQNRESPRQEPACPAATAGRTRRGSLPDGAGCATALWRLTSRSHFLLMSPTDGGSPRE